MEPTYLIQLTSDIEPIIKKARVVALWDGDYENLRYLSVQINNHIELVALGVNNSAKRVLDSIIENVEEPVKNFDFIVLCETGQTVLVIVNCSKSHNPNFFNHYEKVINVTPKDQLTKEYIWKDYPDGQFNGSSKIVHHINKSTVKEFSYFDSFTYYGSLFFSSIGNVY